MKRIAIGAFAGISCLAGCTTHLPGPNATINADAISFAILTELYCVAKDLKGKDINGNDDKTAYFGSQDNWVAAIDMFLTASIEASANPAMSLLGPFNLAKAAPVGGSVGSFTASIGGSFDETRTKLQEYKLYINLRHLLYGTSSTDPKNLVA